MTTALEMKMLRLTTLALFALLIAACGDDEPATPIDESSEEQTGGGGGDGVSDAGPPPDPATYGAISGSVLFEGDPPPLRDFNLKGLAGCDHHHPTGLQTEDYLIENGRLEGAFVYISKGVHPDIEWPVPSEPAVFDQVGCVFIPHTLGVRAGQTVTVNNSDEVGHNINGHPQRNSNFNFSMPAYEKGREIDFRRAEVPVRITCDVHPHMSAYIAVFDNPFFAVSGTDGTYSFENVPPGEYTLRAVHEKLGRREAKLVLEPNGSVTTDFTFTAE